MPFYFYKFFWPLAYSTDQAVQSLGSTAVSRFFAVWLSLNFGMSVLPFRHGQKEEPFRDVRNGSSRTAID
jgi:hypothetical protein